jgi:hypothetical protein
MITKKQLIKAIEEMPGDELSFDELKQKLYLIEELNRAEEDLAAGRTYSNEQMKEIIKAWRLSSGQTMPKAI